MLVRDRGGGGRVFMCIIVRVSVRVFGRRLRQSVVSPLRLSVHISARVWKRKRVIMPDASQV